MTLVFLSKKGSMLDNLQKKLFIFYCHYCKKKLIEHDNKFFKNILKRCKIKSSQCYQCVIILIHILLMFLLFFCIKVAKILIFCECFGCSHPLNFLYSSPLFKRIRYQYRKCICHEKWRAPREVRDMSHQEQIRQMKQMNLGKSDVRE